MRLHYAFVLIVAAWAGFWPYRAAAAEPLPPDREVHEAIDFYIDQRLAAAGVTPAPQADDANLVRRLTLDLAGRIPTLAEAEAYVHSSEPDKWAALVDRLMAAPTFARHQANEFDSMLMAEVGGSVRPYLLEALAEGRGWDEIFRQLVLARGAEEDAQAADFMRRRVSDVEKLTNDVSVLFFGINISCAKCHDHPLVDDWKQEHFYGMTSFFNRTFDNGGFLAEREYGLVKYKTTEGDEHVARLMFLSGDTLAEPEHAEPSDEQKKQEKEQLEELKKNKQPPPPPSFSRRAQLVDVALKPDNQHFFARSIVNRLMYRFMGQGLVMPVDQMHEGNSASHEELLAWLARDLKDHGYDLRRLVRGIVLSRAYARSSVWEEGERPRASLYAVAQVRPLMPQQLAASLQIAVTNPAHLADDLPQEELDKRIEQAENAGRGLVNLFETPGENFQVSVDEALWFSNNERVVRDLLRSGGNDRLLGALGQIEDRGERIRTAYGSILARAPTEEEMTLLTDYLDRRTDREPEAWGQIVWALLTSSEFRFNH